jgi:hypothetical protein
MEKERVQSANSEPGVAGEGNDINFGMAPEPEESIYSHKTETILDEEEVSFGHLENQPN